MSVKNIQITERDKRIFHLLQQFPLLRAETIHQDCFDGTVVSAVGRRLKKLVDYKLLQRMTVVGESAYRYYITASVRPYIDNNDPIKKIHRIHAKHDAELYDCLRLLHRRSKDDIQIIPDFALSPMVKQNFRAVRKYNGKLRTLGLQFKPDALVVQGTTACFIEYDRGTEFGINLFKKLLSYQEFLTRHESFAYKGTVLDQLLVLFICPTPIRLDAIQRAAHMHDCVDKFRFVEVSTWNNKEFDVFISSPHMV